MRKFNNKEEAIKSLQKFRPLSDEDFIEQKENYFLNVDIKPGNLFLYEHVINSNEVSYPKVGIYLNVLPADQTVEVEFVDLRRTIESNIEYYNTYEQSTYEVNLSEEVSEIKRVILWNDSIFVYGIWDKLPNWKELKKNL